MAIVLDESPHKVGLGLVQHLGVVIEEQAVGGAEFLGFGDQLRVRIVNSTSWAGSFLTIRAS
jgi:hypothetical protein